MTATVLDGKALAAETEDRIRDRVEALKEKSGGATPILATILVGDDPSSATYVKMKGNACARVGMESLKVEIQVPAKTDPPLAPFHPGNPFAGMLPGFTYRHQNSNAVRIGFAE